MKSLQQLYKIGIGPSSSHTMGPDFACTEILKRHTNAQNFKVILYGSLCLTGKGHGTDEVIKKRLGKTTQIVFDDKTQGFKHPNAMDIIAIENGNEYKYRVYSIGGGDIVFDGEKDPINPDVYELNTFSDIKDYCEKNKISIPEYVYLREPDIKEYLYKIWDTMKKAVERGLAADGILPGCLNVQRKAKILYNSQKSGESETRKENRLVCSYAYAVAEENASYGLIVTAPTCGASGVIPAVLYYMCKNKGYTEDKIIDALATAGIVGDLIKTNASISGAECGCQAEIGSACSMAAAGLAQLTEMNLDQIEYSAEVAMEHHLGLTCDPVCGLVQIPCIERNAVAAMRAINAVNIADFLTNTRKVSLDTIINTMYQTGKDMSSLYRETSQGGLAKTYKR